MNYGAEVLHPVVCCFKTSRNIHSPRLPGRSAHYDEHVAKLVTSWASMLYVQKKSELLNHSESNQSFNSSTQGRRPKTIRDFAEELECQCVASVWRKWKLHLFQNASICMADLCVIASRQVWTDLKSWFVMHLSETHKSKDRISSAGTEIIFFIHPANFLQLRLGMPYRLILRVVPWSTMTMN